MAITDHPNFFFSCSPELDGGSKIWEGSVVKEMQGEFLSAELYGKEHRLGSGQKVLTVEFATKAHEE